MTMSLIAAKCTQCGANIEVDDSHETGICKYCGTPFITEKVINNYNQNISIDNATINVQGDNIDNLLLRAQQFELEGDIEKAEEYYNKVLDIDINNASAQRAMESIRTQGTMMFNGVRVPADVTKRIESYCKSGEYVLAIKELRAATGAGLKEAKDEIDSIVQKNGYAQPTRNSSGTSSSSQNGCYIATCVYGSYDCPEVWTLRRFRDYTLDTTWYGRLFIKVYYATSPTVVKIFGDTKWFKNVWKKRLDKMVSKLNNNGVLNTKYSDKY